METDRDPSDLGLSAWDPDADPAVLAELRAPDPDPEPAEPLPPATAEARRAAMEAVARQTGRPSQSGRLAVACSCGTPAGSWCGDIGYLHPSRGT